MRLRASQEFWSDVEPWQYSYDLNIARRHLSAFAKYQFKEVWVEHEREAAKKRQACGQGGVLLVETLPQANEQGKSRDKIGAAIGISGKSVDKCRDVQQYAPPEVKQQAARHCKSKTASQKPKNKNLLSSE